MKKFLSLALAVVCMSVLLTGCCLKHEWQDPTCETPMTCAKCGETEGEPLGHIWADATCETAKTCAKCGKTDGEPLGHDMVWNPVMDDYTTMTGLCNVCGAAENAEMDWEAVANDLIIGSWSDEEQNAQLEVLTDGTAAFTLYGETFNFYWNFLDVYEPYEGFNVLMLRYDFNLVEGGYNRAGIFCMQGYEITDITLQIGEVQIEMARQ